MAEGSSPADLVLASASPRRRELLERVGLCPRIVVPDIDESPRPGEAARDHVRRLAAAKCDAAIAVLAHEGADATLPVLAADTTVALGSEILGKPGTAADAAAMLSRLAGRRHEVLTATCVQRGATRLERVVGAQVTFRSLSAREVEAYAATEEWRDKAGGYALQGIAALFVTEVRGSVTAVVGLPLAEAVADLIATGGLPDFPPAAFGAAGEARRGAG